MTEEQEITDIPRSFDEWKALGYSVKKGSKGMLKDDAIVFELYQVTKQNEAGGNEPLPPGAELDDFKTFDEWKAAGESVARGSRAYHMDGRAVFHKDQLTDWTAFDKAINAGALRTFDDWAADELFVKKGSKATWVRGQAMFYGESVHNKSGDGPEERYLGFEGDSTPPFKPATLPTFGSKPEEPAGVVLPPVPDFEDDDLPF